MLDNSWAFLFFFMPKELKLQLANIVLISVKSIFLSLNVHFLYAEHYVISLPARNLIKKIQKL